MRKFTIGAPHYYYEYDYYSCSSIEDDQGNEFYVVDGLDCLRSGEG